MTTFGIRELTLAEVSGINQRAILDAHRKDPSCKQQHALVRPTELASCLAGIFYQSTGGYVHAPVERMAGLLLYRVAEGQFFLDGNKRTAVVAMVIFLQNHGLSVRLDRSSVNDVVWGFAKGGGGAPAKYVVEDAVQFVFENIVAK